jgi:hypothetical protein
MEKNKHNNRMILYRDFQKIAKSKDKEIPHREIYYPVLSLFMKYITDKLLKEGYIKIPCGLGTIRIVGRKLNIRFENNRILGAAPDWGETNRLWERDKEAKNKKQIVYFFNEHTNGIVYSFKWYRKGKYLPNKTIYDFRPSRNLKKRLQKEILNGREYTLRKTY